MLNYSWQLTVSTVLFSSFDIDGWIAGEQYQHDSQNAHTYTETYNMIH